MYQAYVEWTPFGEDVQVGIVGTSALSTIIFSTQVAWDCADFRDFTLREMAMWYLARKLRDTTLSLWGEDQKSDVLNCIVISTATLMLPVPCIGPMRVKKRRARRTRRSVDPFAATASAATEGQTETTPKT